MFPQTSRLQIDTIWFRMVSYKIPPRSKSSCVRPAQWSCEPRSASKISHLPNQVTSTGKQITSFRPLALTNGEPKQSEVSAAFPNYEGNLQVSSWARDCELAKLLWHLIPQRVGCELGVFKVSRQISSSLETTCAGCSACLVWCRLQYPAAAADLRGSANVTWRQRWVVRAGLVWPLTFEKYTNKVLLCLFFSFIWFPHGCFHCF